MNELPQAVPRCPDVEVSRNSTRPGKAASAGTAGGREPVPMAGDAELPHGATALVLVNRCARLAGGDAWRAGVRRALEPRFRVVMVESTDGRAAAEAVKQSAGRGGELLVVAGGDGTVNSVLGSLDGGAPVLALVPLGTSNDLARNLGLPLEPAAAAARIAGGRARRLDVLTVEGRRFSTAGGLGLPADCALVVPRLREGGGALARLTRGLGSRAFHLAALANIVARPQITHTMTIEYEPPDGGAPQRVSVRGHGLFVANHGSLAAGLTISPRSQPDDGVFEICILPETTRAELLATLTTLVAGRAPEASRLGCLPARAARVTCDEATSFFGDGERLAEGRSFVLGIERRAISVVC